MLARSRCEVDTAYQWSIMGRSPNGLCELELITVERKLSAATRRIRFDTAMSDETFAAKIQKSQLLRCFSACP